jgi:carbamate kinase
MGKKAVVALGGNALIKPNQRGTIYEQFATTRKTSEAIVEMIKNEWNIVITHGNGPQVGAILIQQELTKTVTPPMPLGICVAQSQGQIGYMIQQCMLNSLRKVNINKEVVTLITQVIVKKNDEAFKRPTKPVGPVYMPDEALKRLKTGHPLAMSKGGWRILVPSPDPIAIVEAEIIKKLLDDGYVVIAAGGGGMPVVEEHVGFDGREAVIDKDLASERLATEINADLLLILTDVDHVFLDGKRKIGETTLKELEQYYQQGYFPPGSMGPKVLAAIRFLRNGGKRAAISSIEKAQEAAEGHAGTQVKKSG